MDETNESEFSQADQNLTSHKGLLAFYISVGVMLGFVAGASTFFLGWVLLGFSPLILIIFLGLVLNSALPTRETTWKFLRLVLVVILLQVIVSVLYGLSQSFLDVLRNNYLSADTVNAIAHGIPFAVIGGIISLVVLKKKYRIKNEDSLVMSASTQPKKHTLLKSLWFIPLIFFILFTIFSIYTSANSSTPTRLFEVDSRFNVVKFILDSNSVTAEGIKGKNEELITYQVGKEFFHLGCSDIPIVDKLISTNTQNYPMVPTIANKVQQTVTLCDVYQSGASGAASKRADIGKVRQSPEVYGVGEDVYVVFNADSSFGYVARLYKLTNSSLIEVKGFTEGVYRDIVPFGNDKGWYVIAKREMYSHYVPNEYRDIHEVYEIEANQVVRIYPEVKDMSNVFSFVVDEGGQWYLLYRKGSEFIDNTRLYRVDGSSVSRVWQTGKFETCIYHWNEKISCRDDWNTWLEVIPSILGLKK